MSQQAGLLRAPSYHNLKPKMPPSPSLASWASRYALFSEAMRACNSIHRRSIWCQLVTSCVTHLVWRHKASPAILPRFLVLLPVVRPLHNAKCAAQRLGLRQEPWAMPQPIAPVGRKRSVPDIGAEEGAREACVRVCVPAEHDQFGDEWLEEGGFCCERRRRARQRNRIRS